MLRTGAPDERIVGSRKDGSAYYDFSLRTLVATQDGKAAYDQEDQLTGNLTSPQVEIVAKKRFAAEARVPLAPGKYLLEVTLTNNVDHIASKKRVAISLHPSATRVACRASCNTQ